MGALCQSLCSPLKKSDFGASKGAGLSATELQVVSTKNRLMKSWQKLSNERMKAALFNLDSPWNLSAASENIHKVYEVVNFLEAGSVGKISKARLASDPKMYFAIKSIKKSPYSDKPLKLFKAEADLLKEVDHPNIVRFYECYQDAQYYHMTLELFEGPNLVSVVEKAADLSESIIKRLFYQALLAINYLHLAGVVHRDIKLDNFVLSSKNYRECRLVLIDFGYSKRISQGSLQTQLGTPWYIAPEILEPIKPYTEACDVWSLGVVLYMMLLAEPPFKGRNNAGIFKQILGKTIDYSDNKFSLLSPDCLRLLQQMLIKDPDRRISLQHALMSPWFHQPIIELHKNWDQRALKRTVKKLLSVKAQPAFKREVLKIMVKLFSDSLEVREATECFYCCDYMANGVITAMELEHMFEQAHVSHSFEQINRVINSVFLKRENVITYTEFVAATVKYSFFFENHERLKTTFRRFDIDDSGFITEKNIRDCFQRFGYALSEQQVKKFVQEFDADKDQVVSFPDFCQSMKS